MRRTAAWKPIGIVAATTIAIAGFGVAPATAAEDDREQALARVLSANLLDQGLLDAATAYTGTSETPNPVANDLTLDSELLGASIGVTGGLQLPLIDDGTNNGLLALGEAGALSSYAATTTDSSIAASGVLGADGAIAVDPDPAPGTPPSATIDLTQALGQLGLDGLTSDIVDELRLELGAFAARAEADGTTIDDAYALADLTLEFDSPTVGALASTLTTELEAVTTALDTDVAGITSGTLTGVFNALDIELSLVGIPLLSVAATGGSADITVASLTDAVRTLLDDDVSTPDIELISDGVTINLTDGTISVDLAQVVNPTGEGLNGLAPNTSVLSPEVLSGVATSVTTLLGGITGNLSTALETALETSAISLAIPVTVSVLAGSVATATVVVEGTLGGFLDGAGVVRVDDASLLGLGSVLGIDLSALVTALTTAVTGPILGTLGGLVGDVATDATGGITDAVADLGTAVGDVLGELDVVFDAIALVATATVNAQPTLLTPAAESDLGPDGFTVHALEVVLLPGLTGSSLATVALGSASVLNVDALAAGTLVIDPDQARAGETVDLSGTGWNPDGGDVTVTFTDVDGNPVGAPVVITPGADGTIDGAFTVPAGTATGVLTGTADQDGSTTTADLEVVAAPVVIVDPDPVDPGDTITITGSGFLCGPVTVTIAGGPEPIVIADIPVAEDGSWSTTYEVPADIDANTLTITAVATGTCDDEDETDVEIDQPETLELTPAQVRIGDTVTIDGDGWATGSDVTVTFTNAAGQVGAPVVITPGTDGTIDGTFTVPDGTADGALTGTAVQGDDTSTDAVTVFGEPTVIVTPDPVDPGETITISGSGFVCGPVTVTITGGDEPVVIADIPVAADGTWSTTYDVPADIDVTSLTITAVATGVCDDEGETDVEVDLDETLTATPESLRIGDEVTLVGTGWADGAVELTATDAADATVGTFTATAVDGAFSVPFTVPGSTALGTLEFTATQGDDVETDAVTVFGEPVVVVTPDPVDPGETITISGSGFLCGPVTVTIADGDVELEVIEDIEVAADGTWSTTYVVPADTDATSLTITAVATGDCGTDETDVEVDQPETIALSPGEVRGGDDVVIEGDGWNPDGGPVTVVFTDADGNQVGDDVTIDPNDDGSIDGSFQVPPGTPAGELTGTATQGDDSTTDTVAVFDPASVSIEPGTVRAGADVTVEGGGWLPNGGDVTVTFEDVDGNQVGDEVVLTPAADGTIAGDFTVPAGTDPGILTATAVQGDADATDTLAIAEEPSVTVEPDTARPGDTVTVGGGGWADGTPVTVVFTDEDDVQVGEELTLDPTGGVITGSFPVPGDVDPGTLTATATQGDDEATDELEVTLAPTVSATPEQLHVLDAITIGGTGWDPASVVTVTVTNADGETVGTPLGLTPDEGGVITGSFTVPEGTDLGELTITAEQGADDASDTVQVVADPTVVVTPNPADPGQQVTISGDGFLCGPVTVTITAGDTVLATLEGLPVVDGQWSTVYTVPLDVTVDSLTISAVATGICGDEGETDLEVDLVETLTATPAFAEIGDEVTVAGTGWADGAVSITATDASGDVVGTFTATAVEGSFSVPFTVPAGTELGELEFEATQGDDVETATVSVVSIPAGPASIIVSPSTVEAGDTVAVDGEGFDPTAGTVTITFTDSDDAVIGSVVAAVQPDGALFTAAFQVPSTVDPQTLTATAVQGPRTASDDFDVRASGLPVIRLAGPERFQTAVEISRDAFPFGANVVFMANAVKFPDALSAAPAAAQVDAPLLLTRIDTLDAATIGELDRLEPDTVVIVGDQNSVSDAVAAQIAPYAGEVVRLGGDDRFETSQLIAEYAFADADSAYVTTGFNFPDALTAGAAAGSLGAPLLLTHGAQPSAGLIDTLDGLGVQDIYIAGDTNSVAASQDAAFEDAGFEVVERYAGADRFETGLLVAQDSFDGPAARIYVATGLRFPDALAGSAIAGAQNVPVYVTRPNCMIPGILDERDRLGGPQIVLLGDQNALDQNVFDLVPC